MPNEIFYLGLNSGEIAVYTYLMSCEDRKTYQCYPSYNTIGNALKMSKKTVMKYVKSLEDKCLITTEHTTVTLKSGQKQNGNLRYTIRPLNEARDHFYRQQMMKLEFNLRNKNKTFSSDKKKAV
ncbi:MAG: helix-turn-helix domain-containing protein [Clostridia bacterium]|nr:helix-turn-helix domain-containing protein [Clostridia bacterium]